jgi:carbon-monoxide dehydrogenase medium subunit
MKPAPFTYHAPQSVDDALRLLGEQPNARLLAGGQSLVPILNFRLASPDHLIDLNRIEALRGIREEAGQIVFGAMVRQREIEFSALVSERLPLMAEAILQVGHRQTRNRGTLGGSLCHLDPSAEMPTVCMAMDATLEVRSRTGARSLPMAEFTQGMMTTALGPEDMLAAVRIQPWPAGHGYGFVEFARRNGDFAVASAAVLIELDAGNRIRRAALALGGVGPTPLRVARAEQKLVGALADAQTFAAAAAECAEVEALEDPTYPAWYRQHLAKTLAERALNLALSRARPVAA